NEFGPLLSDYGDLRAQFLDPRQIACFLGGAGGILKEDNRLVKSIGGNQFLRQRHLLFRRFGSVEIGLQYPARRPDFCWLSCRYGCQREQSWEHYNGD